MKLRHRSLKPKAARSPRHISRSDDYDSSSVSSSVVSSIASSVASPVNSVKKGVKNSFNFLTHKRRKKSKNTHMEGTEVSIEATVQTPPVLKVDDDRVDLQTEERNEALTHDEVRVSPEGVEVESGSSGDSEEMASKLPSKMKRTMKSTPKASTPRNARPREYDRIIEERSKDVEDENTEVVLETAEKDKYSTASTLSSLQSDRKNRRMRNKTAAKKKGLEASHMGSEAVIPKTPVEGRGKPGAASVPTPTSRKKAEKSVGNATEMGRATIGTNVKGERVNRRPQLSKTNKPNSAKRSNMAGPDRGGSASREKLNSTKHSNKKPSSETNSIQNDARSRESSRKKTKKQEAQKSSTKKVPEKSTSTSTDYYRALADELASGGKSTNPKHRTVDNRDERKLDNSSPAPTSHQESDAVCKKSSSMRSKTGSVRSTKSSKSAKSSKSNKSGKSTHSSKSAKSLAAKSTVPDPMVVTSGSKKSISAPLNSLDVNHEDNDLVNVRTGGTDGFVHQHGCFGSRALIPATSLESADDLVVTPNDLDAVVLSPTTQHEPLTTGGYNIKPIATKLSLLPTCKIFCCADADNAAEDTSIVDPDNANRGVSNIDVVKIDVDETAQEKSEEKEVHANGNAKGSGEGKHSESERGASCEETFDEETCDEETCDEGTFDEGTYDEGTYDDGTCNEDTYEEETSEEDDENLDTYDEDDEENLDTYDEDDDENYDTYDEDENGFSYETDGYSTYTESYVSDRPGSYCDEGSTFASYTETEADTFETCSRESNYTDDSREMSRFRYRRVAASSSSQRRLREGRFPKFGFGKASRNLRLEGKRSSNGSPAFSPKLQGSAGVNDVKGVSTDASLSLMGEPLADADHSSETKAKKTSLTSFLKKNVKHTRNDEKDSTKSSSQRSHASSTDSKNRPSSTVKSQGSSNRKTEDQNNKADINTLGSSFESLGLTKMFQTDTVSWDQKEPHAPATDNPSVKQHTDQHMVSSSTSNIVEIRDDNLEIKLSESKKDVREDEKMSAGSSDEVEFNKPVDDDGMSDTVSALKSVGSQTAASIKSDIYKPFNTESLIALGELMGDSVDVNSTTSSKRLNKVSGAYKGPKRRSSKALVIDLE